MSIATLIRRLGELGATHEMIALAAEEIEAAQVSLEARRTADRDRKRAQREAQKSANVTGHVTPCPETSADNPSPQSPPLKAPPHPLKITPPLTPQPNKDLGARGSRLPAGWEPRPLLGKTLEMVALWPAGMIERELAKFKDHWLKTPGARGRSLDWDASYRNWLRNAEERRPRQYERSDRDPTTVALERLIGPNAGVG